MYIKGITDYSKQGRGPGRQALFAGPVSQDGELRSTKSGKSFGAASVRAFNRKDGTAAFITIKSYGAFSSLIANLRKGDHILCAGIVESREYNGKTYTDMMVDFIMTSDSSRCHRLWLMPTEPPCLSGWNKADLRRSERRTANCRSEEAIIHAEYIVAGRFSIPRI